MVASATTRRIRLSPPRGMARSIRSESARNSPTAERSTVGDELNGGFGQAAGNQLIGENAMQSSVGAQGFLAAAQDDGVSALDAEGGRVDRDVGTAFEDHEDDAERNADLADVESVGPPARGDDLADRVGQGGDVEQALGHVVDPAIAQSQSLDGGGGTQTGGLGLGDVAGVGGEDLVHGDRGARRRSCAAMCCEPHRW